LRVEAARLKSEGLFGFVSPGKESGLFGHFFELHAMAGGRMFEDEGPPIPQLNDEAGRFVYSSSHTFAIPGTVRDRSTAAELLRYLTSRESQAFEARLGTLPARSDSLGDARAEAEAGSLAERRWGVLEEAQEAALIPPKHPNYPAVEDAIWQGVREALLGKDVEVALRDTEAAAREAAKGS
jgi:multiple sugar transport system substrate-binding protein